MIQDNNQQLNTVIGGIILSGLNKNLMNKKELKNKFEELQSKILHLQDSL